ncbi:sugar transferase [Nakamurella alba]|uniref:sugar transferase n=1 Tax=Nakamurella alba TaxID=2665158 RepID=UPI002AC36A5E|nr:sugar transferase [Nakamurella alba]
MSVDAPAGVHNAGVPNVVPTQRGPRTAEFQQTGTAPRSAEVATGPLTVTAPAKTPWAVRYGRRLALTDLVAIIWAGAGAHTVHMGVFSSQVSRDPVDGAYLLLTACLAAAWALVLLWGGSRDASVVGHGAEEYKRVVQTSVGFFGLAAICSYVFNLHLPRVYVLVMLPAGLLALLATRYLWRRWLHVQRRGGRYVSQVLAVGNVRTVRELVADLRRAPLSSYRVVGICTQPDPTATGLTTEGPSAVRNVDGIPVLGSLDDVAKVAAAHDIDVVAVTATASFGPSRVRSLGWELEKTSVDLVLAPALTNIAGPRVHTTPVAGLPLIHVDRPTYRGANRVLKRSFDMIGAALLLVLLSPVILGIAVAMKCTDRGPLFFRQERVGVNGRTFRMVKFRSMVVDAEARLAALQQAQRDAGNQVLFKMQDDPRITRIGKVLRRYSLDELPQLFNVLRGDMSLVGPRPPLRSEVDVYGDEAMLRLLVKPGMTGLWQVSGRSDLSWEDTVRLDTYYVENWSITGDLVILFKTLKAVTSSGGAY